MPSYPGVRLLPGASDGIFERAPATTEVAHYTSKRRISDLEVLPFTESPATIRSVYVLDDEGIEPPPEPVVEHISPRESFMKLVSSSFNLDITDKELLRRQFVTLRRARGGYSVLSSPLRARVRHTSRGFQRHCEPPGKAKR